MKNKKLVIISGVTGAIGSALFAEFGQHKNTVVYGISRKASSAMSFMRNGKLPLSTLICSIESLDAYGKLFKSIDYSTVSEIVYIHALGLYPFEVDSQGKLKIDNDKDGDGINDDVVKLTLESFSNATRGLQDNWKGILKCVIFGGIADKHHPVVHQSWWKVMEMTKDYMWNQVKSNPRLSMILVNISSVLCPHEVITRPFVFTDTDAKKEYWLHPYKLARFVYDTIKKSLPGFIEVEKYNIKPNFSVNDYYMDNNFTPRKVKELYN